MYKKIIIIAFAVIIINFFFINILSAQITTYYYSGFDYVAKTKTADAKTLTKKDLKGVREYFKAKYEKGYDNKDRLLQVAHVVNVQWIINQRIPEPKPIPITEPLYKPAERYDAKIKPLLSEKSFQKVDDETFPVDELFKEGTQDDPNNTGEKIPPYELQLSYPNSDLPLNIKGDDKNAPMELKAEDFAKRDVILRDYVNYEYDKAGTLTEERAYAGNGSLWYIKQFRPVANVNATEVHEFNFFFIDKKETFYVDGGEEEVEEWSEEVKTKKIKKYDRDYTAVGVPYSKKKTVKKEIRKEGDVIKEVKVTYNYVLLDSSNTPVKSRSHSNVFNLGKGQDISLEEIIKFFKS